MPEPIDSVIRNIAVSEQDKNVVVTAGAGTGKTTLLVDRMLHLLLGHKRLQREESPLSKIVAMTFTEKAASEIKIRLMQELEKIVSFINGHISQEEGKKAEKIFSNIRDFYQTTPGEIIRRAKKSLEDINKALIGTIHSFAAYILRLYPIESGIVPGFEVDEGDIFDELFDKEWTKWLERELALNSSNASIWKNVLKRLDIEPLREFTKRLSGFAIPLDSLTVKADNKLNVFSLIDPLISKALNIIPSCEKPNNNNLLTQLNELLKIFKAIKTEGISHLNNLQYDLDKNPSEAKVGWSDEGFLAAQELVKECHILLKKLKTVDESFVATVIDLILPFAKEFRQTYLSQGYVSFDGLLTLTRDLLQNNAYRYVREKLKSEFRAVLVDEFQDTDPVQYEIVLFLSEALGHHSKDIRKVTLEPGKLFIVGDPKQSIYSFRRADIEAYEQVVRQVCGHDETLKLQENFRSHAGIIEVVNQLFDGRIMIEQPGLQPGYVPIHANRQRKYPSQKVEVVLVSDKEGQKLKADEAREAEAEWIARYITEHVDDKGREDALPGNKPHKLRYKDIALLLRAFTQVRPYVEAFKRYGIPYIVEGEKYFYTTQEILDFTNLLRIIENPHDTIALVGVLRSSLVGLTDREIYVLKENNLLDYRKIVSGETPVHYGFTKKNDINAPHLPPPSQGISKSGLQSNTLTTQEGETEWGKNVLSDLRNRIEPFCNFLRKIHVRTGIIPVSQLIAEIIENYHIAEITACAWHGEQKLANLWKLYQMVCEMEQSEGISLKTFIDRIKTRIKEAKEEGESPLSDETLDVVKILSIHKSKGLEFPVVILGNLHGEVKKDNEIPDSAVFDWTTSATGIVIGKGKQQVRNLQSVLIEKKLSDRSWEEEKRVLYVAMTRAKERLILTGALKDDDKSYMGLIIKAVKNAVGIDPGDETSKYSLGNSEIFAEHFRFDGTYRPPKPAKEQEMDVDWTSFVETWKKRMEAIALATQTSLFTSPSAIFRKEPIPEEPSAVLGEVENAMEINVSCAAIVGSVCHKVLEVWDFQGTKEELESSVESAIKWEFTIEKINDKELIKTEVMKILSKFIGSDAYKELQNAQILGREVPILLRWDERFMRGTIDILYKRDDRIIIADYKTAHVKTNELSLNAAKYNYQRDVYIEAVKRCLKIDNPEFKLIFLRAGKAVPI